MITPEARAAAHAAGKHKHVPPQSCPQCREERKARLGSRRIPIGCGKCLACRMGHPWWLCERPQSK